MVPSNLRSDASFKDDQLFHGQVRQRNVIVYPGTETLAPLEQLASNFSINAARSRSTPSLPEPNLARSSNLSVTRSSQRPPHLFFQRYP